MNQTQGLQAVHTGQADVEQDQVRGAQRDVA